jgi:hypothetical protein
MELPSVGRSVIMTTRHCVDVAGAWPFAGRLRSAPVPERGIRDGGRGHFAADSLQEQQNRARGRAVRKAGPRYPARGDTREVFNPRLPQQTPTGPRGGLAARLQPMGCAPDGGRGGISRLLCEPLLSNGLGPAPDRSGPHRPCVP